MQRKRAPNEIAPLRILFLLVAGFVCVIAVYGGFQQLFEPGAANKLVGAVIIFFAGSIIVGMFIRFVLGIDLSEGKDHW